MLWHTAPGGIKADRQIRQNALSSCFLQAVSVSHAARVPRVHLCRFIQIQSREARRNLCFFSFFSFFLIVQSDELRGGPSVVWWQSLQLLGNVEEELVPAASGYPELYERERTTLPVIFYHIKGSVVRNNSPSLSHNSFKSEHTDTIHIWRC